MFEHRHQPLLAQGKFIQRMCICALISVGMLAVTVFIGAVAYHSLEHLSWVDAFLNAVLVMTGLGLTVTLQSAAAKVFTSFYAILSAIVFFSVLAILFAPLIHRAFHRFHLDLDGR
ncbi:MAG: hypothetical protein HQL18_03645 [Candidatus Omnitrophica bacterium]|nr:hypothetical protein [Candidatus Omnitrophota bacterium]